MSTVLLLNITVAHDHELECEGSNYNPSRHLNDIPDSKPLVRDTDLYMTSITYYLAIPFSW